MCSALGEMGIANTTSAAAALCLALFGGDAEDWVGPGTGVAGAALQRKTEWSRPACAASRAACPIRSRSCARLGGHRAGGDRAAR